MSSSNGNIFRITDPLWGEPPVTCGFPSQRPVTQCFDAFFDLRLNKQLSKHWRRQWNTIALIVMSLWHDTVLTGNISYRILKSDVHILLFQYWPDYVIILHM